MDYLHYFGVGAWIPSFLIELAIFCISHAYRGSFRFYLKLYMSVPCSLMG